VQNAQRFSVAFRAPSQASESISWVLRVLDTVKRHETLANVLGALVAIYAAAGTFLLGAKVPSEHFWHPWRWPFILLLAAIVFVPLFALYQFSDARREASAKQSSDRERDRALLDVIGAAARTLANWQDRSSTR
jgi:MFS family permease